MSSEVVYYDIVQKRFVYNATGLELAIKDYPSITFKEQKVITWYVGQWDSNTRTFTNINLSQFSIHTWQSSVDIDFTRVTEPMIRVLNDNIDSTRAKDGIIIVTYNADTKGFEKAVSGQADGQRKVYIELKGYDSAGKLAFFVRPRLAQIYAEMQIDPGTEVVGETVTNYYTKSESDGRYLAKGSIPVNVEIRCLFFQVVPDNTEVDVINAVAYFRIPHAMNGTKLIRAIADVTVPGTDNATVVQVRNMTKYPSNDVLSSAINIASGKTLGSAGVIDDNYDDVSTNDLIKIYIVSSAKPKGLRVVLEYQNPN